MPDRDTIIGWLLIVGVFVAVLYGRHRGKQRLAASMASAAADARAQLTAELNSMASSSANVHVSTNIANGGVVDRETREAAELAWLRVRVAELGGGHPSVQLDAGGFGYHGSADDSSTYDDDVDPVVYRAVGRVHGPSVGRCVPVDRAIGGRDRVVDVGDVDAASPRVADAR